jgi:hypothetical protein
MDKSIIWGYFNGPGKENGFECGVGGYFLSFMCIFLNKVLSWDQTIIQNSCH